MDIEPNIAGEFTCAMDIPIRTEGGSYSYFSVVAVFRRLPAESVNEWLMPCGRPRTDRELATEILVAVRGAQSTDHTAPVREFDVPHILDLDRAAALVISTPLWALPRLSKRVPGTDPPAQLKTRLRECLLQTKIRGCGR